jgi:hypothetical protein
MKMRYIISLTIIIILLLITVIVYRNQYNTKNNLEVGIIGIDDERQDYLKEYFQQYGWNLSQNEFAGMLCVNLMSDEDFLTANEYSKQVGLQGIEKYEMYKFAHTIQTYSIENENSSYEIDFMVQTDSEASKDIQFAVLVVRIELLNNELKEYLYPIDTDQDTIEKKIMEYID